MKTKKRHLRPSIKKALEFIGTTILVLTLAIGMVALLFASHFQHIDHYSEMRYAEVNK